METFVLDCLRHRCRRAGLIVVNLLLLNKFNLRDCELRKVVFFNSAAVMRITYLALFDNLCELLLERTIRCLVRQNFYVVNYFHRLIWLLVIYLVFFGFRKIELWYERFLKAIYCDTLFWWRRVNTWCRKVLCRLLKELHRLHGWAVTCFLRLDLSQ